MTLDLTDSIAPKSDQLDAVDLLSGPRTFTIERVSAHNAEQPFNFHLEGFPRVWRPGKSMRRVIVAAWGSKAEKYAGQRITLYCDKDVRFGTDITGGTRISHMSGITKPLSVSLIVKRGSIKPFTVQPLPDAPVRDWPAEILALEGNYPALLELHKTAGRANAGEAVLNAIAVAGKRAKEGQALPATAPPRGPPAPRSSSSLPTTSPPTSTTGSNGASSTEPTTAATSAGCESSATGGSSRRRTTAAACSPRHGSARRRSKRPTMTR